MVGPEDTIAAVKAYIQEKSGLYFNKLKLLLNENATVLKDNAQTLSSLGIGRGFALILRYVFPVYKVVGLKPGDKVFKLRVKPGHTVGDVKAGIQKKTDIPLKEITCNGRTLEDHELMTNIRRPRGGW
ncbi:hypothetical protein H5410_058647 [Solanum commersonii]|uniref:Ubiquitin-like domain-containing protein n=1 Tax=Solanum commersonii TaxID=4109 RepID=A0A9J5WRQ2_SOLCO|nr:hypothetical protein H5410_058647 [Solanum commersonii]